MPIDYSPRSVCILANEKFKIIADKTGLPMEMINVGKHPNDMEGDTHGDAMVKVIFNLASVLDYLIEEQLEVEITENGAIM